MSSAGPSMIRGPGFVRSEAEPPVAQPIANPWYAPSDIPFAIQYYDPTWPTNWMQPFSHPQLQFAPQMPFVSPQQPPQQSGGPQHAVQPGPFERFAPQQPAGPQQAFPPGNVGPFAPFGPAGPQWAPQQPAGPQQALPPAKVGPFQHHSGPHQSLPQGTQGIQGTLGNIARPFVLAQEPFGAQQQTWPPQQHMGAAQRPVAIGTQQMAPPLQPFAQQHLGASFGPDQYGHNPLGEPMWQQAGGDGQPQQPRSGGAPPAPAALESDVWRSAEQAYSVGQWRRLVEICTDLISRNRKGRIGYYTRRALAYERLDHLDLALTDLLLAETFPSAPPQSIDEKRQTSLTGDSWDQRFSILLSIARIYQKKRMLKEAICFATLAVDAEPEHHLKALRLRAACYREQGSLELALADRDRLAALEPESVDTFKHRASLLVNMGRHLDAKEDDARATHIMRQVGTNHRLPPHISGLPPPRMLSTVSFHNAQLRALALARSSRAPAPAAFIAHNSAPHAHVEPPLAIEAAPAAHLKESISTAAAAAPSGGPPIAPGSGPVASAQPSPPLLPPSTRPSQSPPTPPHASTTTTPVCGRSYAATAVYAGPAGPPGGGGGGGCRERSLDRPRAMDRGRSPPARRHPAVQEGPLADANEPAPRGSPTARPTDRVPLLPKKQWTPNQVGAYFKSLGSAYAPYETAAVANSLSGEILFGLLKETDDQANSLLAAAGIGNSLHRRLVLLKVKRAVQII